MSEPEYYYYYKPGVGWVLGSPYEVLEYDKGGGWWLICENRPRREGESSWSEGRFVATANALGAAHWTVTALQVKINQNREHGRENLGGTCVFRLEER